MKTCPVLWASWRKSPASRREGRSEFKPMRDAGAHTALLTNQAAVRLTTVRQNINAPVKSLPAKGKQEAAPRLFVTA
jgi:hypothetical protein